MRPAVPDFDACVIGSGAGGGPVALALAEAGYHVVVLEKGPWRREADFAKDEIAQVRRRGFTPSRRDEPQVVELKSGLGWRARSTAEGGWDFWNGTLVGGATNLMSGYFHRLEPDDFRLRSAFGPIDGADVVDWPIGYDDLEPYYARVEHEVGVSGRVVPHPRADRRSTPDFPHPPIAEHPLADWIDEAATAMGLHPFPVPRAILSRPVGARRSCEYSGYCGSYGCTSGAKGSARAALLDRAVATGRCEVRPRSMARRILSDARGRAVAVEYHDAEGEVRRVDARVFVVACQPIETARLLLGSVGPRHPRGLANGSGLVGRYLVWSMPSFGGGVLSRAKLEAPRAQSLMSSLPFVNRALKDWYVVDDPAVGGRRKGGTIDFLIRHPAPIGRAASLAWGPDGPLWGEPYKARLREAFAGEKQIEFEVFCDWLPVPDSRVGLDPEVRDRWGLPVARVRIGTHPHNAVMGRFLASRGREVVQRLGADRTWQRTSGMPATNLLGGGCRFGTDPERSVLDPDCRAHEVENLYVSDGSFMPTGGSVPYTWTIYANAFRVADGIIRDLGGGRGAESPGRPTRSPPGSPHGWDPPGTPPA